VFIIGSHDNRYDQYGKWALKWMGSREISVQQIVCKQLEAGKDYHLERTGAANSVDDESMLYLPLSLSILRLRSCDDIT
jgi:hypothetical protein